MEDNIGTAYKSAMGAKEPLVDLWQYRIVLNHPEWKSRLDLMRSQERQEEPGFHSSGFGIFAYLGDIEPRHIVDCLQSCKQIVQQRIRMSTPTVLRNVRWIGRELGLTPVEQALVAFAVRFAERGSPLAELFETVRHRGPEDLERFSAIALGLPQEQVHDALRSSGVMAQAGILRLDFISDRFTTEELGFGILPDIQYVMGRNLRSPDDITRVFHTALDTPQLAADDYAHMGDTFDRLVRLLRGAFSRHHSGVNILLYGPPGTGKTQLARLLVQTVGARGFEIVWSERKFSRRHASDSRLRTFAVSQRLLRDAERTVIVFDEADQVLLNGERNSPRELIGRLTSVHDETFDKAWFHSMLETNQTPTIWIGNDFRGLSDAAMRRFSLIVKMNPPPMEVRKRLFASAAKQLDIPSERVEEFAADTSMSPGVISTLARTTRLMGVGGPGDPEEDLCFARDQFRRFRVAKQGLPMSKKHRADLGRIDLSMVNSSTPLDSIVSAFKRLSRGSLLMYGPPGTGKTAFAHQLAHLLDKPLLVKRSSDLLDAFLGGTEQNVARMFEEAEASHAVLFMDEADGMLRDRAGAQRSWEVTRVSELLQQMEIFSGVFLCATNLMEGIDQASLRRFSFKVRFEPNTFEQRVALLRRSLREVGVAEVGEFDQQTLAVVRGLADATLGDFAAAVRKVKLLGSQITALQLAKNVASEVALHENRKRGTVGFLPPSGSTIKQER